MEIKDSHFLITGANRGIGRSVAFVAAREGAHLYLGNRTSTERTRLERELLEAGAKSVRTFEVDLSSTHSLHSFLKNIATIPFDIVFNNAGQLTGGMLEDQDAKSIDDLLQVNVNSLIHITRGVLPGMHERKKGKVINHASVAAVMPFPGASTYAATKAAVLAFTRCLQYELHGTGVTALALITGSIETRMLGEIPQKFGGFLDTSGLAGMDPDRYALRIRDAILDDVTELKPTGISLFGFWVASLFPTLYRKFVQRRFRRAS